MERQGIVQVHELQDRHDIVVAVVAAAHHLQAKVDLGVRLAGDHSRLPALDCRMIIHRTLDYSAYPRAPCRPLSAEASPQILSAWPTTYLLSTQASVTGLIPRRERSTWAPRSSGRRVAMYSSEAAYTALAYSSSAGRSIRTRLDQAI